MKRMRRAGRPRAGRAGAVRLAIAQGVAVWLVLGPTFAAMHLTVGPDEDAAGYCERWDLSAYPDGIPFLVQPNARVGGQPILPVPVPAERIVRAARNAFHAWQDVPTSAIRFAYAGTTDRRNGLDGRNVVTLDPDPAVSYPPGAVAETYVWYEPARSNPDRAPGEIFEADIVVHTENYPFRLYEDAPAANETIIDLLGILTHEVGHFCGLEHNGLGGSVMYGAFAQGAHFPSRTLEEDDAIGASVLYPTEAFLASTGAIEGEVRLPDGTPVFGAQVTALDAGSGAIWACASTGLAEFDARGLPVRFAPGSGAFRLHGLPPGDYRVAVEPLDGPLVPGAVRSGIWTRADTLFAPALSEAVTVAAGAASSIDIALPARDPGAPNLGEYAFWSPDGIIFRGPAYALRGTAPILCFARGEGVGDLDPLQFPGGGIAITDRAADDAFLYAWTRVDADAPLGPRLLVASNASGEAYFAGAAEVLEGPPEIAELVPREGGIHGGGIVTVRGRNLSGDRIVLVGGVAADVLGASPGAIRIALPPAQAPGEVPVAVCTDLGLSNALPFTYMPDAGSRFVRGDANGDGALDLGDAVVALSHLFAGAPAPCRDACDLDDDGRLDLADPVSALNYLFAGGPSPAAPFPGCGTDPDAGADGLDCQSYDACP